MNVERLTLSKRAEAVGGKVKAAISRRTPKIQ
jgi:hypothetical protein